MDAAAQCEPQPLRPAGLDTLAFHPREWDNRRLIASWWVGSQLDIDETRELVPGQNATTLQVAASVLGAVFWMIRNPRRGFNVPDDLPHDEVLGVANHYLGPCPSVRSDWTPLLNRVDLFAKWGGAARPADEDVWQFGSFLA